jgi:hypothetical protein
MDDTRTNLGPCQVRSATESPCLRPAVMKIRGVPFCELCAGEQERYAAIGELASLYTQADLPDHRIDEMFSSMVRTPARRRARPRGASPASAA